MKLMEDKYSLLFGILFHDGFFEKIMMDHLKAQITFHYYNEINQLYLIAVDQKIVIAETILWGSSQSHHDLSYVFCCYESFISLPYYSLRFPQPKFEGFSIPFSFNLPLVCYVNHYPCYWQEHFYVIQLLLLQLLQFALKPRSDFEFTSGSFTLFTSVLYCFLCLPACLLVIMT